MNGLASVDNHSPCLNWGCKMVSLLILLFYWLAFFVKESSSHLVFFPAVFWLLFLPPAWLTPFHLLPKEVWSIVNLDTSVPYLKSFRDKLKSMRLAQGSLQADSFGFSSLWTPSCTPFKQSPVLQPQHSTSQAHTSAHTSPSARETFPHPPTSSDPSLVSCISSFGSCISSSEPKVPLGGSHACGPRIENVCWFASFSLPRSTTFYSAAESSSSGDMRV